MPGKFFDKESDLDHIKIRNDIADQKRLLGVVNNQLKKIEAKPLYKEGKADISSLDPIERKAYLELNAEHHKFKLDKKNLEAHIKFLTLGLIKNPTERDAAFNRYIDSIVEERLKYTFSK